MDHDVLDNNENIDDVNYSTIDKNIHINNDPEVHNDQAHVSGNFVDKMKNIFTSSTLTLKGSNETDDQGCLKTYTDKISVYMKEKVQVETNYTYFFILLSIGLVCFCSSLFILPFVFLSPGNFIFFFSIGCIFILISFLFVYGTQVYFSKLFSSERVYFTLLFFGSLIVGIVSSCFTSSFLLSLICAVLQLISLLVFVLSFIPGGNTGIGFIGSSLMYPLNKLLGREGKS
jgi:hypothetical protein